MNKKNVITIKGHDYDLDELAIFSLVCVVILFCLLIIIGLIITVIVY